MPPTAQPRSCPRDGAPLTATVLRRGEDAAVDLCTRCHGVFLDKNELRRLTGDRALNAYLRDAVPTAVGTLACPGCGAAMSSEPAAGITVEVCTACHGLWLDAGELDALRARRDAAPLPEGARRTVAPTGRGALLGLDDAVREIVRRYL